MGDILMAVGFPFDLFTQAFEGNWVAWATIILGVSLVAIVCAVLYVWWKMPELGKRSVINETIGGHKPTAAVCYENKRVRFMNPTVFANGLFHDRGQWFIPTKLWGSAFNDLNEDERGLLTGVYSIEGSQQAFYLNYSIQAGVTNPELLAIVQHEEAIKGLSVGQEVRVPADIFVKAMEHLKAEKDGVKYVTLKPMNLTLPLDIRNLRTVLPKALSKSNLVEIENKVRQDVEAGKTFAGVNLGVIGILLNVITLVAVIALHFFG